MKRSDGFTLTETLIAFSIVMMLITTAVPIMTLLTKERANLNTRLSVTSQLHDELQKRIWDPSSHNPDYFTKQIENKTVDFTFITKSDGTKGCVAWINERSAEERVCLYGRLSK